MTLVSRLATGSQGSCSRRVVASSSSSRGHQFHGRSREQTTGLLADWRSAKGRLLHQGLGFGSLRESGAERDVRASDGTPGTDEGARERVQATAVRVDDEVEEGTEAAGETELVFKLERKGTGWSEEILPHLVVEHRPVASGSGRGKKKKHSATDEEHACSGHNRRGNTTGTSKYIQLEEALLDLGLTAEEVNNVISVAVAWRVTDGGQILVDRLRRSKALRNVQTLVPYLETLGLCRDKDERGVGRLIAKVPLLILCNVESSDNWDKKAVQLAAHWFKHGTFQVSTNGQSASELKRWMHRVRRNKATGKLSSDQVKLLELIGFDFGLGITSEWEGMFDRLVDFVLENGHTQVKPLDHAPKSKRQLSLHDWTEMQRVAYAAGKLATDHVERLDSINFDWHAKFISSWLRYYMQFRNMRSEGGTLRVSALKQQPMPGTKFWGLKQQALWYTCAMMPERETLLKEAHFNLDPYSKKFNEVCGVIEVLQSHHKAETMLALLVRLYDDLLVPPGSGSGSSSSSSMERGERKNLKACLRGPELRSIARWMKIQVVLNKGGLLSPEQKKRLDKLGMQWEGLEWQMNFEALLKFRAINGHCDVNRDHKLHAWVVNMRQNRHDLPFEYKSLLDMVGFTWEKRGAWSKMFAQLSAYYNENGHVAIPRQSGNYLYNHLGAWLVNQRALWRKGKLSGHQISRLQAIGVTK